MCSACLSPPAAHPEPDSTVWYYAAMILDLILRFLWTLTLIPDTSDNPLSAGLQNYLLPFLAIGEVLRRSMWALLRVENEHLHNVEGFRRVDFIPLHFDTHSQRKPPPTKPGRRVLVEVLAFTACVVAVATVAVISGLHK